MLRALFLPQCDQALDGKQPEMTEGVFPLSVILRTTYRIAVDLNVDGVSEATIDTMRLQRTLVEGL